ncbi:MAG: DUF2269 family protein [Dehalococcoidia bacterium]|nr:DUF2269 family protein [Dehalococcoidia bacterium]MCA9843788.1 DUF2269 family protein [Dehalococcoidia bacterium]
MDSYKLLLFLHVVTAIVALGSTFALPFLQGFASRQGVGAMRTYLKFTLYQDNLLVLPGAALVALFGVGLIFDDATGYKDDFPTWLMIAIAWFIVVPVIDWFLMRPLTRKAIDLLEGVPDDGEFPTSFKALESRAGMLGGLMGLSVIGITFLMVWKP